MPAYGAYPVADAKNPGDEISSIYEGRHITLLESDLVHPTHADGLVDKGDPVVSATGTPAIVGVAFKSAAAATDRIAIDTEGIWVLDVVAADDEGNVAVAGGDRIYINMSTAVLSKIANPLTNVPFGIALGIIASGSTLAIAVKVHQDPAVGWGGISAIIEEVDHADFTDNTDATGYIDLSTQLPAGAIPLGVKYIVSEGFAGDTTAVVQTGVSGDLDRFSSVTDQSVLTDSTVVGHVVPADTCDGIGAAQTVRVTVTGGADWGNITAGTMLVCLYYIQT